MPRYKKELKGTIVLPASKSITNRVLLLAQLCDVHPIIENVSGCDDALAMKRALEERGATIDVGAAGTAMRFLTAYFASCEGETRTICGTERMHERPIGVLVSALRELGADIDYADKEGFPPLIVRGKKLRGGSVEIAANVSSQYISALLMIAPTMERGLQLRLRGKVISHPYIELTISLMRQFGVEVGRVGEEILEIAPQKYERKASFTIESDWSAASYWYELVALSTDSDVRIVLPGLRADSLQGDSRVAELFRPLGVETLFTNEGVELVKCASRTEEMQLDLTEQPDLAQTIVVTLAMLRIPFRIKGLQTLRIKETDRISALQAELRKFGISVEARGDSELLWDGHQDKPYAYLAVDTYNDHRMAMAFAPCGLMHPSLIINHPEVVSKSYPHFWEDLQQFHQP